MGVKRVLYCMYTHALIFDCVSHYTHTHTHTHTQDIELGDSAVLSMCAAGDKVWLGFEIGYLIVFDANTKKPYIQVSSLPCAYSVCL